MESMWGILSVFKWHSARGVKPAYSASSVYKMWSFLQSQATSTEKRSGVWLKSLVYHIVRIRTSTDLVNRNLFSLQRLMLSAQFLNSENIFFVA